MTDQNQTPNTELPQFSVNVVPTRQVSAKHLSALLQRFRSGENEPLIFGDGHTPEAAIIPFSAFVHLLRTDHAEQLKEDAFQAELFRRIQHSDEHTGGRNKDSELIRTDDDLIAWGESIGEPFASMLKSEIHKDDEDTTNPKERDDG